MRGYIHSTLQFFFFSFPSVSFPYLIHHSICWLYVDMYFLHFFFLTYFLSNLTGMAYNFHKYGSERIDSRGVSYDYDSIMHYSSTAFANRAGAKTIVGKNGRTNLGQRYGLSKKDIQQANLLYCGARPAVTKPPPKPTPCPSGEIKKMLITRATNGRL